MIHGYIPSAHLIEERSGRILDISTTIGFGEIIFTDKHPIKPDRVQAVTSTGVILIIAPKAKVIVTMYCGNFDQLNAIFKNHIPAELKKTIKANMKKYPSLYK